MKNSKKTRAAVTAALILSLLLTGCDVEFSSGFSGLFGSANAEVAETIPAGQYPAIRSTTIQIDGEHMITLPAGFHYAARKKEADTGDVNIWYCFRTDDPYISPQDDNIMFYILAGTDLTTPAASLKASQVSVSFRQNYLQNFVGDREKRSNVVEVYPPTDPPTGEEEKEAWLASMPEKTKELWAYQFTSYDNHDTISATYGTLLYPKYYYGLSFLERESDEMPSREWTAFIFSNDAEGQIFNEQDYTSLIGQIKQQYGDIFPSQYETKEDWEKQHELNNNLSILTYSAEGYDYEQFAMVMQDTVDYYRVKPNITPEETQAAEETQTEGEPGEETTAAMETEAAVEKRYTGLYSVLSVVDGDTLDVDIDGTETRIRLIGVDTPESVNPDETKNTPQGKEAAEYFKNLLEQYDNYVYIEYGADPEDDYGRTLAYVYVTDGTTIYMVNRMLLENGYARVMTIEPNTAYAADFGRDEAKAEKAGAGFWGTGFYFREEE